MEMDATYMKTLFTDDDLMFRVTEFLSRDDIILFVLINTTCSRAIKKSGLSYVSQVKAFCASPSLMEWAISMGCPTTRLCTFSAWMGYLETLEWLREEPRRYPWD